MKVSVQIITIFFLASWAFAGSNAAEAQEADSPPKLFSSEPCVAGPLCEVMASACPPGAVCSFAAWSEDEASISYLLAPPPGGVWDEGYKWRTYGGKLPDSLCMRIPACRFDIDGNGFVTVTDLSRVLQTLGEGWEISSED